MNDFARRLAYGSTLAFAISLTGCVVGQAPGQGTCLHLQEPETGASYWLYLPDGYDRAPRRGRPPAKYPLVVTFHGMKPFDDANRQIREWQQEADRYGFVVCAPELLVADVFGPLPLNRKDHPSLKRDEEAVIAVMNHVYETVDIDPNRVLATSWSYGGYIAHYMVNRYPERFRCLAVKQSNFNADILDPANVPRYRDRKIAIYYTENDFAICRRESQQAAEWYVQHGFDLTCGVFEKKGHERTPGVAAQFFAQICGIEPKSPPIELAQMQIKLEHVGGQPASTAVSPVAERRSPAARGSAVPTGSELIARRSAEAGNSITRAHATGRGVTLKSRPVIPDSRASRARRDEAPAGVARRGPVRVRVSSTIGVVPLLVSYSAIIPEHLRKGARLLWTDNGQPLSNGVNGQKVFAEPGDHTLEVWVTTSDGARYRASRIINVIRRAGRTK